MTCKIHWVTKSNISVHSFTNDTLLYVYACVRDVNVCACVCVCVVQACMHMCSCMCVSCMCGFWVWVCVRACRLTPQCPTCSFVLIIPHLLEVSIVRISLSPLFYFQHSIFLVEARKLECTLGPYRYDF